MSYQPLSVAQLTQNIGKNIGVSEWVEINQNLINGFADLTDDHQFIHVNEEAASKTPFGGTIAHGFLILSMLAKLGTAAQFAIEGVVMGVNYGFDKVRMVAPVRAGKRIRGSFVLKNLEQRAPGQWLATLGVTVEIEGEDKPAVIADWLALQVVA